MNSTGKILSFEELDKVSGIMSKEVKRNPEERVRNLIVDGSAVCPRRSRIPHTWIVTIS
jgi:hypothetical protein